MKVIVGCDHAGLELKKRIVGQFQDVLFVDAGCFDEEEVDYPQVAEKAARLYFSEGADRGILICGTGIGISIAANKMQGIYCASIFNRYMAKMAREHNNANFIAFGGRLEYNEDVLSMVELFLTTPGAEGRHLRRVNQVKEIEGRHGV